MTRVSCTKEAHQHGQQALSLSHAGLPIFLSIAASLGNVLILVALNKASSIHPRTKLLFRCLAVTDLCVGFIVQPASCHRYHGSVALIRAFWSKLISNSIALVSVILSIVVALFSYTKIFLGLRQHQAHLQVHAHDQAQSSGKSPLNIERYKKTVSSIPWVQLALGACYTPYGIAVRLWVRSGLSYMVISSAVTLVFLNSSLNQFLYCWKIRQVREEVKTTTKQIFCQSS